MNRQPNLWPYLIERDPNLGAPVTMALGRMGSGKTNGLVHVARRLFERKIRGKKSLKKLNPDDSDDAYSKRLMADEIAFWIGDSDAQWRRVPSWIDKYIFVESGLNLHFYRNGAEFDPLAIPFGSYPELLKLARPDALNVVYSTTPGKSRELIEYLIKTPRMGWGTVVCDEVENLIPGYESGKTWHEIDSFVKLIKRARKRRISIFTATQVKALCDHRFTSLVMYWMLHPGCRAIPQTRVYQGAIDGLARNEAWLASQGSFQKVRLPLYLSKDDVIVTGLEEYRAPKPPTKGGKRAIRTGERVYG